MLIFFKKIQLNIEYLNLKHTFDNNVKTKHLFWHKYCDGVDFFFNFLMKNYLN